MKVKDLVNSSVFGTIATIKDEFSIRKLDLFLQYNLPLILEFKDRVVIAVNKMENTPASVVEVYKETLKCNIPECTIIEIGNRGHMFGTIDLEEAILKYTKSNFPEAEYLFKSMDDVVTYPSLLEVEIEPADFYYIPGFSYESILKVGSKEKLRSIYETFESGFWTPQTTFFILRINNIDLLYGDDIDYKHSVYIETKRSLPEIKPWEIPFDIKFDCETHLGRTVKDMSKYCLIKEKFKDLLDLVESVPIWDPSHKNVFFKDIGVCHYHYYEAHVFDL